MRDIYDTCKWLGAYDFLEHLETIYTTPEERLKLYNAFSDFKKIKNNYFTS
jgi:hypothetical protein